MEILSSRVLLHPVDHQATLAFYRDVLGLGIAREFGDDGHPGTVFSSAPDCWRCPAAVRRGALVADPVAPGPADVHAELERLAGLGVKVAREARTEPPGA